MRDVCSLTAVLLNIHVLWNVTACPVVNRANFLKDLNASLFKELQLFENENVYQSKRRNVPENLILQQWPRI